ncbi:pyridoxal-phosphate dependent enzyme [Maribacter sp. PR1]|uniref:Pyridoxal-phosphate dependent enzyme n=1 Tax=Maribacter cobaltidurans TaxID=1178778 RepID=A0ABU7J169_9FLAO|nr:MULTISPECIES: pyridoxal-phosphate dependent enzyme [Maribacter]MDC6391136.1 pyridoxal-phosphate dependent enzyme [Maribacter sp. PR1]MEE1978528.1 pyridoxal-phosphate dependent enzyme [Maribacter cobaltidurans]
MQIKNQYVDLPILKEKNIVLALKREDLIHPLISGNKFRKLKYNVLEAIRLGHDSILTFGGAFSNHILATAAAGKNNNLKTIGIIRGDEIGNKWIDNPTLKLASENGMQFKFVSRESYRNKENSDFLESLKEEFGTFYLVPEGGTNSLAIKGCEEILVDSDSDFEIISVCVGTGGTMAGLINAANNNQRILGFPVLKGDFFQDKLKKLTKKNNWTINSEYHFGGYGKIDENLVRFINEFKEQTNIPLDPVYTGKMMYGLLDMIENDNFVPGTRILAIHTGGLQGIAGMNTVLEKKKLPLLDI